MKAILGKKLGMTQLFASTGEMVPVTVIETGKNTVVVTKTAEADGYNAVQLGFGAIKESKVTKPMAGQFKKANVAPVKFLREIRSAEAPTLKAGDTVGPDVFAEGDLVDVTGTSKGKGFAGTIKRYHFARGPKTHGSKSYREPGSVGAMMSGPGGRVFKGKKLPGHMGHERVTIQRLTVAKVDAERGLLLVKGAVPGPKKGLVIVRQTVKPGK